MPATLIAATNYLPLPASALYYTLKDDDVYYAIPAGALSFSFVDQIVSRARNYRDEPPVLPAISSATLGAGTASGSGALSVPSTVGSGVAVSSSSSVIQDDNYTHVAPRNEPATRTYMVFWSGATGSGNVLLMFPEALFEQFSGAIPARY